MHKLNASGIKGHPAGLVGLKSDMLYSQCILNHPVVNSILVSVHITSLQLSHGTIADRRMAHNLHRIVRTSRGNMEDGALKSAFIKNKERNYSRCVSRISVI